MVARNRDNGEGTWPPPCLGGWVSWEIRSQRAGVMRTCRRMLWGHRKSLLAGEQGGSFHCTALSGSNGLPAKVLTALLPEGLPCSSRAGAWEAPASLSGLSLLGPTGFTGSLPRLTRMFNYSCFAQITRSLQVSVFPSIKWGQ